MDSVMPDLQPEAKKVTTAGYLNIIIADKPAPPLLYLYHSPSWYLTLAINYMSLNELDKALSEINRATEVLDKNSPLKTDKLAFAEVHTYTAGIYLLQNNIEKALEENLIAFNIDPKNIGAIANLGMIYCFKENYDMAVNYYKIGLDINPNFPGILSLKERLIKQGRI